LIEGICYAKNFSKEDTIKVNNLNSPGMQLMIKGAYLKAHSISRMAFKLSEKKYFSHVLYHGILNNSGNFWCDHQLLRNPNKINSYCL
jgi:hypothetical protein